jgi:DNA repair exonuclease SbcCD ATPase subunit
VSQSSSMHDSYSPASPLNPPFSELENDVALELTITPADYQALLSELAETRASDQEKVTRIYHLEQALDQAIQCISDLKAQVQDQQVLESQLANTEEFAYVQQQAIARLKLQIAEQGQALEAQILETQQRDQAVEELLVSVEVITQTQQRELERLRLKLAEDQREAQGQRTRMSIQLQDVQTQLESRQLRVSELEAETLAVRASTTSLQVQLESARDQIRELSAKSPALVALRQDFAQARGQVEELEQQIAQQTMNHTRWQQIHQEVEEERDRLQIRVTNLELQTAEMQEQVLHQAQHATEQETAVQYWKDRYLTSQDEMAKIKEQLQQVNDPAVRSLLAQYFNDLPPEKSEPRSFSAIPLPKLVAPDLPEFLTRRRGNKSKPGMET